MTLNQKCTSMHTKRHERGQHVSCEPTYPVVTVIKTWRREHSDGSHGFVEQLETGTFLAVDFVPVSEGLRTGAALREFSGLEDACGEADRAAQQRGHVCDKHCHDWRTNHIRC